MARSCVRKKVAGEDVGDDELDPLHARMRTVGPVPWETQGQQDLGDAMDVDEGKGNCTSITAAPGSEPGYHPAAIPVPDPSIASAATLLIEFPGASPVADRA